MKTMLVDGNNILMRAARATDRVPLSADGVPTAALLVFINSLARHVREEKPDQVIVCWDGGRSAFRTRLHPGYKAARRERVSPDEDGPFSQAKEFLRLSSIQQVEFEGWEADDLIAAYCRRRDLQQGTVVIVSSDKDLLQLVNQRCEQVRVSSQPPSDRWDYQRVLAEMGCIPMDLARVMALTGDTGDGVPGLRGIGPKRAVKMLRAHHWNLDEVIESLSSEDGEKVRLAYRLVDLCDNPWHVRLSALLDPPRPFQPVGFGTEAYPLLHHFLVGLELRSIEERIKRDTLWTDSTGRDDGTLMLAVFDSLDLP